MDEIKKATVDHFRNFVGSKNREVDIPEEWLDDYKPIDAVDDDIYKGILDPITDKEWKSLIKDLPIGKQVDLWK